MKRGVPLLILPAILMLFATTLSVAGNFVQNIESRVIASFDDPAAQRWHVQASKFTADGFPMMTYADAWPEAVFGRNRDGLELRSLGVRAAFDRRGYNYIEFIPVNEDPDGNLQHDPITLPGRVRNMDMWVWGSNYDFYIEAHVRDFTGRVHVLHLGSLKFVGWRNLAVAIPNYIPQAGGYITEGGFTKNLVLLKLVLWTKPTEPVDGFNVYIDHLKILTDVFVTRFDGDELADPERVQEIWGNTGGNQ